MQQPSLLPPQPSLRPCPACRRCPSRGILLRWCSVPARQASTTIWCARLEDAGRLAGLLPRPACAACTRTRVALLQGHGCVPGQATAAQPAPPSPRKAQATGMSGSAVWVIRSLLSLGSEAEPLNAAAAASGGSGLGAAGLGLTQLTYYTRGSLGVLVGGYLALFFLASTLIVPGGLFMCVRLCAAWVLRVGRVGWDCACRAASCVLELAPRAAVAMHAQAVHPDRQRLWRPLCAGAPRPAAPRPGLPAWSVCSGGRHRHAGCHLPLLHKSGGHSCGGHQRHRCEAGSAGVVLGVCKVWPDFDFPALTCTALPLPPWYCRGTAELMYGVITAVLVSNFVAHHLHPDGAAGLVAGGRACSRGLPGARPCLLLQVLDAPPCLPLPCRPLRG